jgi:hypothetical protein
MKATLYMVGVAAVQVELQLAGHVPHLQSLSVLVQQVAAQVEIQYMVI